MQRLEVEDDEQRERRIQLQLEKLNEPSASSSGAPQTPKPLNFDFDNRMTWDVGPPTELLSRVQAFLPQMQASNTLLAQQVASNPESVSIEHINENMDQYIEMNLGLGVFEDRTRVTRQAKEKAQHGHHKKARKFSSAASSSSETSSFDHDEMYDSDSSDPDTDSSSEIITSFKPAPRMIKPLPKRSLASRAKPMIQVLNEVKEV